MSNFYPVPPNMGDYTYIHGFGFISVSPQNKERNALRSTFSGISIGLLVYMLLELVMPIAIKDFLFSSNPVSFFLSNLMQNSLTQIIAMISIFACSLSCFAIIKSMVKIPFRVAVPCGVPSVSYWVSAFAIFQGVLALGIFLSMIVERMFGFAGIYSANSGLPMPVSKLEAVIMALNLCIFTPIFEESIFRGIILQSLRRFGDGYAILLSAICFALLHRSPFMFPDVFISGLAFGFFAVKTRSLLIPVLLHSFNNIVAIVFQFLSKIMPDNSYQIVFNSYLLLSLIICLAAFIYLLNTRTNAFSISSSPTLLPFGKKIKAIFSSVPTVVLLIVILIVSSGSITF